ncbi:MAG: 8-oxo-dGTP diphosphatase MutT [Pseudomonadota bacterium]
MAKEILLVSACALVDDDNRILIAKRPPNRSLAGLWEFPGGKIEKGETPELAIVRELKEELDIEVHEKCLSPVTFASYSYEKFHLLMPLYISRCWDGEILAKEGQDLKWVKPNALEQYDMPPADDPLKTALRDVL